jgi:hypothetical protein
MTVKQAEHDTAGSRLYGHGGEGRWQQAGDCMAPGDRGARGARRGGDSNSRVVHPRAASTPQRCGRGGAHRGGAGAAAIERKADERRGREEGVQEPQWSRSQSRCVIF